MAEVSATDAARALADFAGVEHNADWKSPGAGMPGKKFNLDEPKYAVDAVGDHLFVWSDEFTKELIMIKVAQPVRSGIDFWCVVTVKIKQPNRQPVSIFTKKRWNLTSVSNGTSIVTALNKREPDRNWDGRLALVEQYINCLLYTSDAADE